MRILIQVLKDTRENQADGFFTGLATTLLH
jgi:hypothetical protein